MNIEYIRKTYNPYLTSANPSIIPDFTNKIVEIISKIMFATAKFLTFKNFLNQEKTIIKIENIMIKVYEIVEKKSLSFKNSLLKFCFKTTNPN